MAVKYVVRLTQEERETLAALVARGNVPGYRVKHANILLKTDADGRNWTDQRIAEAFGCHRNTVGNVRKRFVEQGLEAALSWKQRSSPARPPKLQGPVREQLIALCEGPPPEGRSRWTLRLLGSKLVELELLESVSPETIRQALKKTA